MHVLDKLKDDQPQGVGSAVHTIFEWERREPHRVIFDKFIKGDWVPVTARETATQVRDLAKGLISLGINSGDCVAIASSTRFEWHILDFAIWAAGAVTVPIFETSSSKQISWCLESTQAKLLFIEGNTQQKELDELGSLPQGLRVLSIDAAPGEKSAVQVLLDAASGAPDGSVEQRYRAVQDGDPATIIFTSGTTGKPKGVVLTHSNFTSLVQSLDRNSISSLLDSDKKQLKTIFFLPLAHIYARAASYWLLSAGVVIAHYGDTKTIVDKFSGYCPHAIVSVPRVLEKIYAGAQSKAEKNGKGKIFEFASQIAQKKAVAQSQGSYPLSLRLQFQVCDILVFSKLKKLMGGCSIVISGGAPLSSTVEKFFTGIGIKIYQGYGLTETTGPFTLNDSENIKIGTVGKPLYGNQAKIAEDGEILLKGPLIFSEYLNNEKATSEAVVDGWFHSGDLGKIDADGVLTITGRKKDIIVTAGGKNVSPSQLEDVIIQNKIISQAVVIGDGKPFVAALVTLDADVLVSWKKQKGIPDSTTIRELKNNPDLQKEIQRSIEDANDTVSRAESIREFRILDNEFSVETGELTQTLKVKRNVCLEKFAATVEEIYSHKKKTP